MTLPPRTGKLRRNEHPELVMTLTLLRLVLGAALLAHSVCLKVFMLANVQSVPE
jgi:hypothetical protein